MSKSLAEGQPSLPLKSSAFIASCDLQTTERTPGRAPFDMEGAFTLVRARLGLTNQQLAAYLAIDGSQLGKAIRGVEGHVPFGKLIDKAPDGFWEEFLPLLGAHFGMQVTSSNGVARSVERCLIAMADVIGRMELVASDRKVSGL